mgnify:CR=1 FL=1
MNLGAMQDWKLRVTHLIDHAAREYGYRDFSDPAERTELGRWLDARAWATAERPSVLG